jgi:hypothetical protein
VSYYKDREDYFLKRIKQNGIMLVIEWHYVATEWHYDFIEWHYVTNRMALC